MDRGEFDKLPLALQVSLLADELFGVQCIADAAAPRIEFAPKYDTRIGRKQGFMWASELNLESLNWWRGHMAEKAAGGGQYAEKNAKLVEKLDKWIRWRMQNPAERWQGIRDNDTVTAPIPVGKPQVHDYGPRKERPFATREELTADPRDSEEYGDIPF